MGREFCINNYDEQYLMCHYHENHVCIPWLVTLMLVRFSVYISEPSPLSPVTHTLTSSSLSMTEYDDCSNPNLKAKICNVHIHDSLHNKRKRVPIILREGRTPLQVEYADKYMKFVVIDRAYIHVHEFSTE